ncbi:MAG: cell division protein SepF [Candidatus Sericytochromatia bacterium]|nr:cell division protein SepF [Candidatus Sericytochromatia bacterium]
MGAGFLSNLQKMVGFDPEDDDVYDEAPYEEAAAQQEKARQKAIHATPLTPPPAPMPSGRSNIVGLPTTANHEVVVIEPRSFDEALGILDNLRSRKAVILNLMGLAPEQSQRLVDFVSGACHALDGHQDKIGESIFLFTPSNVVINTFQSERDWMGNNQQPKDLFWRVR